MPESYPGRRLRVAAVAFRSEFGDVGDNLRNMLRWIDRTADQGADLVCFPEIALQGYCTPPEVIRGLAEPLDGPSCTALQARASARGVTVSAGMSLRDGDSVYNSQVFLSPGGFLGAQHKVHLCGNDRAYEPGNSWETVRVGEWTVGSTICFDSEFPEAARVLALKGVHLYLMSFATGRRNSLNQPARPEDWMKDVMVYAPSRAYDNRIFVVGVNHAGEVTDDRGHALANPEGRPGIEEWAPVGTIHRWPGYSFAISPMGTLLNEAERSTGEENMVVTDLDPALLTKSRTPIHVKLPSGEVSGHFTAVRRVDTFADILKEYGQVGP